MLPSVPEGFTPKSFWERKEGTTGIFIGIPLVVAGLFGLYKILLWIITLFDNLLHAIFLGISIFAIAFLIADKRFRDLIWNMYKSAMRGITRIFVEIDPIGVLNNYVDKLKNNARNMDEQIGNLKGELRNLANQIESNEAQKKNELGLAKQAQAQQKQAMVTLKTRNAGRLENSNLTLQRLYTKMELLYRVLSKMYETCLILIEDLSQEVKVRTTERNSINAAYKAYQGAAKILQGQNKEMFDMSMDFLVEDAGRKVGEIEHFMEVSKNFLSSIDLQNGVYEEQGLQMLEKWEKESDSLLLGDQKKLLIAQAEDPNVILDLDTDTNKSKDKVEKKSGKQTDYNQLFEKQD